MIEDIRDGWARNNHFLKKNPLGWNIRTKAPPGESGQFCLQEEKRERHWEKLENKMSSTSLLSLSSSSSSTFFTKFKNDLIKFEF